MGLLSNLINLFYIWTKITLKRNKIFIMIIFDQVNVNYLISKSWQALKSYIKIHIYTRQYSFLLFHQLLIYSLFIKKKNTAKSQIKTSILNVFLPWSFTFQFDFYPSSALQIKLCAKWRSWRLLLKILDYFLKYYFDNPQRLWWSLKFNAFFCTQFQQKI